MCRQGEENVDTNLMALAANVAQQEYFQLFKNFKWRNQKKKKKRPRAFEDEKNMEKMR